MTSPVTRSAGRPQLLAWAALLLATVYVVLVGGTYAGIAVVQTHIAAQVIAFGVLGTWLVVAVLRPAWRPTTPLLLPVLLVAAAYILSGLFSQRPRLSLEPTLAGLGYAVAFVFLTRLLADRWFRRRVEAVIVAGTAAVALGYGVQVVLEWITWWRLVGGVTVPPLRPSFFGFVFGSPNLVATFLFLAAPLGIVVAAQRFRSRRIPALIAVAFAIAVVLSGSRGAFLGVGAGIVVAIALVAERTDLRRVPSRLSALIRRRPIVVVPGAVVLLGVVLATPLIAYRFAQGGDALRLDLWRSALSIFAAHPLLGGGPGTWVQLKVEANPVGSQNIIVAHAHDAYVQAAAELGVVGLIALAILGVAVGRRLHGAWRHAPDELGRGAGAVIVGLVAFAGQSLVDNLVNVPFVCLLLIAVVAWVDAGWTLIGGEAAVADDHAPAAATAGGALPWRWLRAGAFMPAVVLAAMVASIPTVVRIDGAEIELARGNDAALAGDWPVALERYESALAADPDFTLYQLQRSSALARVGRTQEARDQLQVAVEADPVAVNLVSLAALDLATGDGTAALAHARQAVALGAFEPTVALNAGLVGEATGDSAFALDQFANAVAWDPALAGSPFWESADRVVAKADVVAGARARTDPETAALILAYGRDPAAARTELEALPPSGRRDVYLAAATWLGGDRRGAQARLATVTERDPRDWFAAAWMARISRLSGDLVTADRYAHWASIVQNDVAPSVIQEASVIPADPGDPLAGLPANYPWAVYLRPISPFLLAPQVVRIGTR